MLSPLIIIATICFMGSGALIPIMYLGVHGQASLPWIFSASTLGIVITDAIWFFTARFLGEKRVEKLWIVSKDPERLHKIGRAIKRHEFKIIFWSKFIHGTGMVSQLAAGMFKMPWPKAAAASLLGSCLWAIIVFLLARSVGSLSILENHVADIKIGFIVFALLFVAVNIVGMRFARDRFSDITEDNKKD